jgi:(1->4)-alpha-D-glucan 1-alpha-D-glucosylmutase
MARVQEAVKAAKERRPDLDVDLFDFLGAVLVGRHRGECEDELVVRFQQVTGPVMAKGVEDTAFYTYNRLVCLNEVGGSPGRFGVSVEEFHRANQVRAADWPDTMLATSTHDTKRSEDVRARIALLSEIPRHLSEEVARWSAVNERHRVDGFPDRNAEWLFYQTLIGAWPLPADRALAYMEKASKEAKEHTSWVDPDPAYDEALRAFVEGTLGDPEFTSALERFAGRLVTPGRVNSLAQTLLKLTSPGVPDLYQGSELWDLSLVDPDNRRPVDFPRRRRLLEQADEVSAAEAWEKQADSGLPKLILTRRALDLRCRRRSAFAAGSTYEPLSARGAKAGHAVAFLRGGAVLTVAPRLVLGLGGEWGDTTLSLPSGTWTDVLDGARTFTGEVALADLLAPFPVALLELTS